MAAYAFSKGKDRYSRSCYALRATVLKKYKSGEMTIGDLYKNLIRQMTCDHNTCWYCGRKVGECGPLTADHIFPRAKGGASVSDNLIMACRFCNSSKGTKDLLVWYAERGEFPPMRVLAHYLKLVNQFAMANDLLNIPLTEIDARPLPFDYHAFPLDYPPPGLLNSSKPIQYSLPKPSLPPIHNESTIGNETNGVRQRRPDSLKGKIRMADDFDALPEGFAPE